MSPRTRHRRPLLLVVAVLAMLLPLAVPATADVAEHPDPGVVRPRPAHGAVVHDGKVTVEALLHARAGVSSASLTVNGTARDFQLDQVSTYTTRLRTTLDLSPGRYIAEVRFTDNDGTSTRRAWEFHASEVGFHRLSGDDRMATAIQISRDLYRTNGSAPAAVLARAGDFADALAGAPAASAVDGPLLLTPTGELRSDVAAELERVLQPGATVYLLGGPKALDPSVEDAVKGLGFTTERLSGSDRFGTAADVLQLVPESATAFVASGLSFPDALAASAPATRDGVPILLTAPGELPDATRAALRNEHWGDAAQPFGTVFVVGGPAVVTDEVLAEIEQATGGNVIRVAGPDRYATAARVAGRFYDGVSRVAIASGERFPDALPGGRHAGAKGVPLLLSPGFGLARPQVDQIAGWGISGGWMYGGPAVLEGRVAQDAQRAVLDGPGLRERSISPPHGATVNTLDAVVIQMEREVDIDASSIYVEVANREVYGVLAQGDFASEVVFRAGALPFDPAPNEEYPGHVWALVRDGDDVRHLEWTFTLKTLDLGMGDLGPSVRDLQERLTSLGYWLGTIDGRYGSLTSQAVMAFQKYEGLPRTGSVDQTTRERLATAGRPRPKHLRNGRYVEIDKSRQVMMFIVDGRVEWLMNTSTGTEDYYWHDGEKKLAHTPEGTFEFFRQIDGMRDAPLGQMWRPKYFTSAGHAIHGSTSVPSYPASHGCARLTYPAIDFVWAAGLAPLGTTLYVYR